jgi:hypothetical protein
MKRSSYAVCVHLLALCLSMIPHLSAFAGETTPISPDAPLPAPVAVALHSPATIFLPTGDLFRPLLADPKEPRFYLSYRLFKFGSDQTHAAVGGYGEFFGLYRHVAADGGVSWQANFGGGIHAQFDLHAPSLDLVNTDYTIGFPFSFRRGTASYRLAIYHQSSHLGDEYLLHNNVQRVELSYEALQAIGSYEWTRWRVYYGGEYIMHQGPTAIKPVALQGGIEYYDTDAIVGRGRLVGAWDLKSDETHDWSLNSSVKFGLQFDSSTGNGHCIRVLAEGYKGFTPYGQFYTDRSTYAGIGVYLGFE